MSIYHENWLVIIVDRSPLNSVTIIPPYGDKHEPKHIVISTANSSDFADEMLTNEGIRNIAESQLYEQYPHLVTTAVKSFVDISDARGVVHVDIETQGEQVFGLDDCANWKSNTKGDCGGKVERVGARPLCETCRNR